jgi:hypothetical protein
MHWAQMIRQGAAKFSSASLSSPVIIPIHSYRQLIHKLVRSEPNHTSWSPKKALNRAVNQKRHIYDENLVPAEAPEIRYQS